MNEDLPTVEELLESAAALQRLVPDAVLVGGTAAAFHAQHRTSVDHDHVVVDLADRFDLVLDALEREPDWLTNRVTPSKIIPGELGGIESGVRQLIRVRPLEVERHRLASGSWVTVPTLAETLRIKAYLVVKRNRMRDYLDVAALADRMGLTESAAALCRIDECYTDIRRTDEPLATQVAVQLADPRPRDTRVINQLAQYKRLEARWTDWDEVCRVCQAVAAEMLEC